MSSSSETLEEEVRRLRLELDHLKSLAASAASESLPLVEMALKDNQRRLQIEQRLADARRLLELAQEVGGVASYFVDLKSDEMWWSDSAYQLYGLNPAFDSPSIDRWLSTVHIEDRGAVAQVARAAIEEGKPIDHVFRVVLRSGQIRWIHDRGSVQLGANGRPARIHGVNIDITNAREAQDALAESEEQFRYTFEWANVGVAHVSVDGGFLRTNQRLCELLGRSQAELQTLTFQDITHPDDLDADLEQVGRLLGGEIDTYSMEKRYTRPDGSVIWCDLSVSLLRRPDGSPKNFISIIADIDERKKAQEQLQLVLGESNHRVKNLLTVIGAIVRTTARSAKSPRELEDALSERLLGIAASHDLLMGKYEVGAQLDKLIQRQLDIFTDCATERVICDGPPLQLSPPAAQAFGMVLHELATNACKYGALSDDNGRVRISWHVDETSDRLHFSWIEEDGPEVVMNGRQGFGTRMLERMLTGALGGSARLAMQRDGVKFDADLDLSACRAAI